MLFPNTKKNENNDLLREIIHQKISQTTNQFKGNLLYLTTENITVAELGEILGQPVGEIVAFFWEKGQTVNQNQPLSANLLADYCQSKKIRVKKKSGIDFNEIIQEYLKKTEQNDPQVERPPLVSIMGHIDHGKTTLLDTIHQTQVQKKEVGGITQKVSISQAEFQGKKITFLDTPGHSDFIRMRQRGISLTDLVVLVIDARDGVMSQTEEIINYLQQYKLPVIVFLNHKKPPETDNETNLNRIKNQLQEKGLISLEWGGETIVVSGNAKAAESVKHLLENILLLANFKASFSGSAHGVVIDSCLHSQTGSRINELLIQGGQLQVKDNIFLNGKFGQVKMMHDVAGNKITIAFPGDIVQVTGLTFSAELGDRFLVANNEKSQEIIEKELTSYPGKKDKSVISLSVTNEEKHINLILLADSQNTLEALHNLVKKNSVNFSLSVVYTAIGNLNNFALDLAKVTHSTILVFGCQLNQSLVKTLKENNLPFFSSKIIYEIEDKLKEITSEKPVIVEVEKQIGEAQVKEVFYYSKVGNIAGCQVVDGKITRNSRIRVYRRKGKETEKVFVGNILSLQGNKIDIKEVGSGKECGIVLKGFDKFQIGDKITAFQIVKENVSQT